MMRIALVQMAVTDGDVNANVTKAEAFIRQIAPERPDVILLPELWTTGYACEQWSALADEATPRVAQQLVSLAGAVGATIGGTMVTRRGDGALVNRFSLTAPSGEIVAEYDKSHLFAPMREKEFLEPGTARVHVPISAQEGTSSKTATAALSICYDLRFPGMYRASAHEGAELYLVASAWPEPRCAIQRTLATARAMENQAFLALCNRVGPASDGTTFCGGSMVVAPAGEILLDLKGDEGVGVADVKVRMVTMARSMLAVLKDDVDIVSSLIAG
jgi:predicted amidohydrolase